MGGKLSIKLCLQEKNIKMAAGSSFVRFSFCKKGKCLNLINHPLVAEWGQIFVEKMHFAFCKSFHLYFCAAAPLLSCISCILSLPSPCFKADRTNIQRVFFIEIINTGFNLIIFCCYYFSSG